ncbi:MAG: sulfotransferase [Lapillicoccus sp.]
MPDRDAPDQWLDPETTHPPRTPDPVVVLYVGGMPRGGTTLLDLMIGQLPGHVAVGELFYIWLTGLDRDRLCGCGETFHQCPFWQKVGDRAFGGWDQVDLPAVKQLVRRVDRTVYLPLLLAPWLDKRFQARLAEYQRVMTSVYSAIAEVAGASVVVDSSKRPSLAYALRSAPGVDLRLVHMMRDPRGVVQSWSQEVAIPDGAGARDHLKVRSAREVTRRWVTVHTMIGGLLRLGVPGTTIRYEDLVLDPQGAMRAAAAVTGTPLTDGDLDFLGEDGLHLSSHHTVAGGRIRFNSSPMPLRLDEKWRREMPARRRRFVEIATWPMRRRHGYH